MQCTSCHDPHDDQFGESAANYAHLISFNPDYVTRGPNGGIRYHNTGPGRGNCTLTCHGASHANTPYPDATARR